MVELNEVLDRLKQGPSQSSPQRVETSDTSGDETDASQGRRKVLSKNTYRMKKVYAATELGKFFVTGASDAAKTLLLLSVVQEKRVRAHPWAP